VQAAPVTRISRVATVGSAGGDVDQATEREINSARSGGQALDGKVRRKMEGAFGADFGGVRVHVGPQSDALNNRIQAKAFTTGADIFVRQQDYSPTTSAGQKLLAHELAHTIQQGGAGAQRSLQRTSNTIQRLGGEHREAATKGKGVATKKLDSTHGDVNEGLEMTTGGFGAPGVVGDDSGFRDSMAQARAHDTSVSSTDKITNSVQDAQLGVVGGVSDSANMFIGLSKAIAAFKKDGSDAWDKTGAVLDGAVAVTGGAKGVGNLVKSGSQIHGEANAVGDSAKAAGGLGGFADTFAGIKSTFTAIKGIVDLCTKASEMSDGEKLRGSMEVIKASLEAAKSGVTAAKGFLDMINQPGTGELLQAVPGLGIAIGCVEIIMRAYDIIVSQIAAYEMRDSKREAKSKLAGGKKGTSSKGEAEKVIREYEKKQADKVRVDEYNAAQKLRKPKPGKEKPGVVISPAETAMYNTAHEYLTAKSLQYINDKRTRRALLKIGVAMTKIAGDAATLGGVSAHVGIALKVAAVVLDLGATIVRKFKQWARDKVAAHEAATGEKSKWSSIFNTDKTTEKKDAEYERIIDDIFDMILEHTPETAMGPITKAQATGMAKTEKYINAMGFSMSTMKAESAKGGAYLRMKMMDALKKRE